MYRYKQAERLEANTNFKLLYQYMGGTLNDYVIFLTAQSSRGPSSSFLPAAPGGGSRGGHSEADLLAAWSSAVSSLTADAGLLLDAAMSLGMHTPIALFARAAIALSIGTPEECQRAVDLLAEVIEKNNELTALEGQGVPVEDTISVENAYNQRALALMSLQRHEEAERHFMLAVEAQPLLWEAYINLASLYFEINRVGEAQEVLRAGAQAYARSVGGPLHLTFMIQLGFAEELLGHYRLAYEQYREGVSLVQEFRREGLQYDVSHAVKLQNNADNMLALLG